MDVSETGTSGRGWNPAPTIFVRGLAGCVTVALVRVVATGRRGRRPLRLVWCRTPSVAVGAGFHPRPDIISKRRRRFTAFRETAGGDGVLFLHRRRQSIFQIDAAQRAAASLFSIVTQDGQRRIFQRRNLTAPKRRIGLPRSVGEAGGTLPVRWVHTPIISRFSLGRHSRFFGQGPKKWGGISTSRVSMELIQPQTGYHQRVHLSISV